MKGGPDQPELSIEPLASHHDRAVFSCGVDALDRYMRQQAGQYARKHAAVAFVLVEEGSLAVLGFYTLAATSVQLTDLPEATAKKLPRYPLVPAILLGRLAVDRRQRGKRYGELLLMDALNRCLDTKDIGWAVVIVDAKDEAAVTFYEHYHFIRFAPSSYRLFLLKAALTFFGGEIA
jgi:GNAT superfamily N-acetyltransferase